MGLTLFVEQVSRQILYFELIKFIVIFFTHSDHFSFLGQVLFTMWQHTELREVYKKHGWKEADFVTKTVAARNSSGLNSPNNANR